MWKRGDEGESLGQSGTGPKKFDRRSFYLLVLMSAFQTGQVQVVNPLISRYAGSLGIGVDFAGLIVGAFSAAALLSRPLSVALCGKWHARLLTCASSAAMGGASLLYLAAGEGSFLPIRLLHGFSYAMCTTVLMAMAGALLPPERTRRGMSLFGIGQVISVALAPAAGIAISNAFGYAPAFWVSAAMSGLVALLVFFVRAPKLSSEKVTFRSILRLSCARKVLTAAVITFTSSLETAFILVYGEGLGAGHMGLYFTVSALVMLAVRAFGGKEKGDFVRTMVFSLAVMAVSMAALWFGGRFAGAAAFWILMSASAVKSLGQGIAQPAIQAECIREEKGEGLAAGIYYFGCDAGQALGPVAGGFVASALGYPSVWLVAAALLALSAVLYLFLRRGRPTG